MAPTRTYDSVSSLARTLEVLQALSLAKGKLEAIQCKVVGEVSYINTSYDWRVYFSINDQREKVEAILPCRMRPDRYAKLGLDLKPGMLVELEGKFSVAQKKGALYFETETVKLAGEGVLLAQRQAVIDKLQAEGLMEETRKRPIPAFCTRIGVVTSPSGAVIHEIVRKTRERFPLATLCLAGVAVEGPNPAEVAQGIIEGMRACYRAKVDVIILARGGGSLEDRMPFNDEALARAISKCDIPVVTALAHGKDTHVADMVADAMCLTPTDAAVAVTPDAAKLCQELALDLTRMTSRVRQCLRDEQTALRNIASRPLFRDPRSLFTDDATSLDMAQMKLSTAMPNMLNRHNQHLGALSSRIRAALPKAAQSDEQKLNALSSRLRAALPKALSADKQKLTALSSRLGAALPKALSADAQRLDALNRRLGAALPRALDADVGSVSSLQTRLNALGPKLFDAQQARLQNHQLRLKTQLAGALHDETLHIRTQREKLADLSSRILEQPRHDVRLRAGRLEDLSPLAILARGYAITRDESGNIVRSASKFSAGDELSVTLNEGTVHATVNSVDIQERN